MTSSAIAVDVAITVGVYNSDVGFTTNESTLKLRTYIFDIDSNTCNFEFEHHYQEIESTSYTHITQYPYICVPCS